LAPKDDRNDGPVRRAFVLGMVKSVDGLPLVNTLHGGNVAKT